MRRSRIVGTVIFGSIAAASIELLQQFAASPGCPRPDAGFVDVLAGQANIGSGETVLIRNGFRASSLPSLFGLRLIVFLRQTTLGLRANGNRNR